MKRQRMLRNVAIGVIVALVIVVAVGGVFLFKRQQVAAPATAATPAAARIMELAAVDVGLVERGELAPRVALSGTLHPYQQVVVKSQVAGELAAVTVREGQPVRKGEVLARFDGADIRSRVDEKTANIAAMRAQLRLAEKTRDLNRQLLSQNFISQNAFDNTQSSAEVMRANLQSLEAQLEVARKAWGDSTVRSPMDGIVAERFAQAGEKLPIDARIVSVVDLGRMELAAVIPASEIAAVRTGQSVRFTVDGFGDRRFDGKVDRINPAAEDGTRSIRVYAVLDNADGALRGGMFATGSVLVEAGRSATLVPLRALREENGEAVVFRIDGEQVVRTAVRIGMRDLDRGVAEVIGGLEPGQRVLDASLANVRPGDRVRLAVLPGKT